MRTRSAVFRSGLMMLALLLAPAVAVGAPPDAADLAGRWSGGLALPGDFISIVVTVDHGPSGWHATTAFPNQGRANQPTRVETDGATITFRPLDADGSVDGVLEGVLDRATLDSGVIRGEAWEEERPEQRIPFVLVRTAPLSAADADRYLGDYRTVDGDRVVVRRVLNATDHEVLSAHWARGGASRTLFPVGDGRFIAGPEFESPWPPEVEVLFSSDGHDGRTIIWRDDLGERVGTPAGLVLEPDLIAGFVEEVRRESDVASVSIGIVHGDDLVYAESFGVCNRESAVPATPDTLYQIASVTKTFTATLLAMLRDEGVVRLDDPVALYLPPEVQLPTTGAMGDPQITLRHLVTHTSGLRLQPTNFVFEGRQNNNYTAELLYECLAESSLQFPAGSAWSYSNLGYILLSHALANAAGESYEDLLRDRIFEPLGMHASTVNLTAEQIDQLATHYWPDDPKTPTPPWLPGEIAGQGGVTSNIRNMARYMSFQLRADHANAGPLSGATLREIQRPQRLRPGTGRFMGLGWLVNIDDTDRRLTHSGYAGGNSSFVALSPDLSVGVCVLCNSGWAPTDQIGEWLMDVVVRAAEDQSVPMSSAADAAPGGAQ